MKHASVLQNFRAPIGGRTFSSPPPPFWQYLVEVKEYGCFAPVSAFLLLFSYWAQHFPSEAGT